MRHFYHNPLPDFLSQPLEGMVIVVPQGKTEDPTRKPEYYDATYDYLKSIGLPEV